MLDCDSPKLSVQVINQAHLGTPSPQAHLVSIITRNYATRNAFPWGIFPYGESPTSKFQQKTTNHFFERYVGTVKLIPRIMPAIQIPQANIQSPPEPQKLFLPQNPARIPPEPSRAIVQYLACLYKLLQ